MQEVWGIWRLCTRYITDSAKPCNKESWYLHFTKLSGHRTFFHITPYTIQWNWCPMEYSSENSGRLPIMNKTLKNISLLLRIEYEENLKNLQNLGFSSDFCWGMGRESGVLVIWDLLRRWEDYGGHPQCCCEKSPHQHWPARFIKITHFLFSKCKLIA